MAEKQKEQPKEVAAKTAENTAQAEAPTKKQAQAIVDEYKGFDYGANKPARLAEAEKVLKG